VSRSRVHLLPLPVLMPVAGEEASTQIVAVRSHHAHVFWIISASAVAAVRAGAFAAQLAAVGATHPVDERTISCRRSSIAATTSHGQRVRTIAS